MRLRLGVAMPERGGRTAIVGVEVREGRDPGDRRLVHEFTVGTVERVTPFTVEAAAARVAEIVRLAEDLKPCVIIDVGTAQGMALRQSLRSAWSRDLHRPHAYPGAGKRVPLFSAFLQSYSAGSVHFETGLPHRAALDKALILYMGGGVRKDGIELESEDEALVIALGLALYWPKHGPDAREIEEAPRAQP